MMVPIRAAMEQHPMAMFLITVGKSSEETAYTTQNDDVTPNFPNISSSTATTGKSGGAAIQHHKLKPPEMSDGSQKMQRYHSTGLLPIGMRWTQRIRVPPTKSVELWQKCLGQYWSSNKAMM